MLPNIANKWSKTIDQLINESCGIFIGVFQLDGYLLYANKGMNILLDLDNLKHSPVDWFVNPTFNDLIKLDQNDKPVFEGVLTAGNGLNMHRSINACVFRQNDQLLICGEYDVLEMDKITLKLTSITQELSTTQRNLMKEKKLLKRTLNELKKTQAMLVHSEKMNAMGQMVAGVAHEINNPVAYVISNLSNLKESFSDLQNAYLQIENAIDKYPELIEINNQIREKFDIDFILDDFNDLYGSIHDGVLRVKKIVQDLRVFSRLDEAEIKKIDIKENIEKTLLIMKSELNRKNINVNLMLDNLPLITCYSSELNQVFFNLIINASQAMEQGGYLTISSEIFNDKIKLDFTDTGSGILEEHMDKIFNPFFTTKPVGSGTGLGLSLAYSIITNKHGGSISVQSKINKGTTFSIVIPKELKL